MPDYKATSDGSGGYRITEIAPYSGDSSDFHVSEMTPTWRFVAVQLLIALPLLYVGWRVGGFGWSTAMNAHSDAIGFTGGILAGLFGLALILLGLVFFFFFLEWVWSLGSLGMLVATGLVLGMLGFGGHQAYEVARPFSVAELSQSFQTGDELLSVDYINAWVEPSSTKHRQFSKNTVFIITGSPSVVTLPSTAWHE